MIIPKVEAILNDIEKIHARKNADYTSGSPFENFERTAEVISWFKQDRDKTYVNQIATKLARLATLLGSDKEPNNESIDDSFLDLCTYCVLWAASHKKEVTQPFTVIDENENRIRLRP